MCCTNMLHLFKLPVLEVPTYAIRARAKKMNETSVTEDLHSNQFHFKKVNLLRLGRGL